MRIGQARETARQWVIEEASAIPGFRGAYTAGSTNWLPEDASLGTTSDLDIMAVLTDPRQAGMRRKFRHREGEHYGVQSADRRVNRTGNEVRTNRDSFRGILSSATNIHLTNKLQARRIDPTGSESNPTTH